MSQDDGQDAVWTPPRAWTAWPMKPSELPAEPFLKAESDENDHFTFRRKESEIPSAELEAEMHAHILRHAKRRFRKHMSRLRKQQTAETILPSTEVAGSGTEMASMMTGMESQASAPSSRAVSVVKEGSMPASELENGGGGYDTEASSATTARRRKRKKLHEFNYYGPQGHPGRYNQDRRDYEPRVMEDEEYAESLLRMPVRHILSRLDRTLAILHYGREAGVSNLSDSSDTEEAEDDDDNGEEMTSVGEQLRASTGKGQARSSKNVRGSSADAQTPETSRRGRPHKEQLPLEGETHEEMLHRTARESRRDIPPTEEEREEAFDSWLRKYDPTLKSGDDDENEEDERQQHDPRARSQNKHRGKGEQDHGAKRLTTAPRERRLDRIGLRDWSDVLGAASLAGFPEAVVSRAARRCAELFGEGMMFRQLNEVGAEESGGGGGGGVMEKIYRPEPVVLRDSDMDEETGSEDTENGNRRSLTDLNTRRRIASRQASLVRKRSISPSTASTASTHADHARGRPHAPSTTRSRSRSASRSSTGTGGGGAQLYCPVAACPRAVEGFGRRGNLARHVQRVHGRSLGDAEAETGAVDSADEMEGGVHVDGFLRRIVPAAGWRGQDLVVRKRRKGRRRGSDEDEDDDRSD